MKKLALTTLVCISLFTSCSKFLPGVGGSGTTSTPKPTLEGFKSLIVSDDLEWRIAKYYTDTKNENYLVPSDRWDDSYTFSTDSSQLGWVDTNSDIGPNIGFGWYEFWNIYYAKDSSLKLDWVDIYYNRIKYTVESYNDTSFIVSHKTDGVKTYTQYKLWTF
jgi:hypothetical protein